MYWPEQVRLAKRRKGKLLRQELYEKFAAGEISELEDDSEDSSDEEDEERPGAISMEES